MRRCGLPDSDVRTLSDLQDQRCRTYKAHLWKGGISYGGNLSEIPADSGSVSHEESDVEHDYLMSIKNIEDLGKKGSKDSDNKWMALLFGLASRTEKFLMDIFIVYLFVWVSETL